MAVTPRESAPSAPPAPTSGSPAARCPIDHSAFSNQKTALNVEPATPAVARDAAGVWHVRSYEQARAVLRSGNTKQAGFNAELLEKVPGTRNPPVLYQDGEAHHEQRRQTARFFTPKAVSENYRRLMEKYADKLIRRLRRKGSADLSELSLEMAVQVAADVVGLTNHALPGMDSRLNAFFTSAGQEPKGLRGWIDAQRNKLRVAAFFFLDVKPSIKARRNKPGEDVISHLLANGANEQEILTECITYGAAGMITTREFISIATWHLLEQHALRERYLAAPEQERLDILHEVLRLEPVVGNLWRRTTDALPLEVDGATVTVPKGELINVHIHGVNGDEKLVGEYPLMLCPQRPLSADRVGPAVMSFGDGHHRCPGAYIAIQETDIFLQRLLRQEGLRVVKKPSVTWNALVTGYELRDFILAID